MKLNPIVRHIDKTIFNDSKAIHRIFVAANSFPVKYYSGTSLLREFLDNTEFHILRHIWHLNET